MTMTLEAAPAGSGLKTVSGDSTNMVVQSMRFRRNVLGQTERLRREYGETERTI